MRRRWTGQVTRCRGRASVGAWVREPIELPFGERDFTACCRGVLVGGKADCLIERHSVLGRAWPVAGALTAAVTASASAGTRGAVRRGRRPPPVGTAGEFSTCSRICSSRSRSSARGVIAGPRVCAGNRLQYWIVGSHQGSSQVETVKPGRPGSSAATRRRARCSRTRYVAAEHPAAARAARAGSSPSQAANSSASRSRGGKAATAAASSPSTALGTDQLDETAAGSRPRRSRNASLRRSDLSSDVSLPSLPCYRTLSSLHLSQSSIGLHASVLTLPRGAAMIAGCRRHPQGCV